MLDKLDSASAFKEVVHAAIMEKIVSSLKGNTEEDSSDTDTDISDTETDTEVTKQ